MKEEELRGIATCKLGGEKIGKAGVPMFWRVKLERYMLNIDALKRQQGLGMMLGGHGALAMVMGVNEDMAETFSSVEITVCETCCTESTCIAALAEDDETEFTSKVKSLSEAP